MGIGGPPANSFAAKGTLVPMDVSQLQHLEHLRALLPDARIDRQPKLLLFARSGFTDDLVEAAQGRADVELVDLNRMYSGE
jgi:uncharacterized protein